jgi:aspartyl-tRNA(Asn)/glutamyl-tRNA(Gln) amidotransferase subunit C
VKITDKQVEDLAHLARLEFNGEEKETIKKDLSRIIDFCDVLQAVDTTNVTPLIYLSEEQNILRDDLVGEHLDKKYILQNAPLADSDYIKVPKVKSNH